MEVLPVGATGVIGRSLPPGLTREGHGVTCDSRSAAGSASGVVTVTD